MECKVVKCLLTCIFFTSVFTIYVPNEIEQTSKPYTTGIKIKTSHYKTLNTPYYHSNYSKVYFHNKNYTSSLLDSTSEDSRSQDTHVYPVYISDEKREKIKNLLKEHNTNVVEKDTLNNRVVFKRRIEKLKNIQVFNTCPKGVTGQFVYDSACNQYLDCWNGRGGPRNCAPGTLFNPKTLECDFPEKVECLTGPTGSFSVLQRSAKLQKAQEQAKCPENFSGLIPNYTDCSKFAQCNNGIQTARDCPPGTLFDINLNVCNHPNQAICFSGKQQISGQSGYVIKEEYGGSADTSGSHYDRQYGTSQGQKWQASAYSGQPYRQFHGQGSSYNQVFYGDHSTDEQANCDPTNPYCNSGGYVISDHAIYSMDPPINQSSGRESRYHSSNQRPPCSAQSADCSSPQASDGTVYIQFVMCNPSVEDCSAFQQGTFLLGPGGALCNPATQQCGQSTSYIPSNKMTAGSQIQIPKSGSYFVKYVMCNTAHEDCSQYQKGIIQAAYGVPGTLIGAHPVEESGRTTQYAPGQDSRSHSQPCNPQYQKCEQGSTVLYQGHHHHAFYPGSQVSGSHGSSIKPCNPQYQRCLPQPEPNVYPSKTSYGIQENGQTDIRRNYPSYNKNNTNYKKVCAAGDNTCYQHPLTSQNQQNQNAEAKCPSGFVGLTKHPTKCKQFLNCANGITYVQDCGPGTVFNPVLLVCDFPYNVDCRDDESDITTTPDYTQNVHGYPEGCQGQACGSQYPSGYKNPGQYNQNQDQYGRNQGQGQIQNPYGENLGPYGQYPVIGQNGCQGYRCDQGQGQLEDRDYEAGSGGGHINCQGSHCIQEPPSQGREGISGCRGSQCEHNPQGTHISGAQRCKDEQCQTNYGYGIPKPPHQSQVQIPQGPRCQGHQCQTGHFPASGYSPPYNAGSPDCQGRECDSSHKYPTESQGQLPNYEDETPTTTTRIYGWPTKQGGYQRTTPALVRPQENGHVMKIPTKSSHQRVQPVNKFDRVTSGGFNNQRAVDYVDIFDPNESKNLGYATTTQKSARKTEKQVWPPPFPDLATSDPSADYVFEYEDGEPVTLAPENVQIVKRKKTRCGENDFVCDKRSCVSKNFVCDDVKDCDDGKDEKHCEKYLNQFKPYKNSRLDVLEKQRWDNVSYSTCALLCKDNNKFECKSFNYRKIDRACFLTDENIGSSGALKTYYPCDYYERKDLSLSCTDMHKCPNGKCLSSDQVCDGYDDCGDRADEKGCRPEDFGYSIQLAAGHEPNEGRIEVTVFGKTGYVCDDQFDIADANIVCKELGYQLGALDVKGNSYFAEDISENHTLYMMDDIECFGNETSLMQCSFAGWGIHNCADREIAGVICRTPEETCREGFWKCDSGNECVSLPFVCDGLDDCTDNSDEANRYCDAPIEFRLVNGTKHNEGRLEVRYHGIWGSVCDDDFNEDAAKIVCKTLGYYGSALVRKEAYFGEGTGPIWLDQVACKGNETSLEQCTYWEWGKTNCDHSEDVGIICSNNYLKVEPKRNSKHYESGSNANIQDLDVSQSSPEPMSCGYRKDNIFLHGEDVHFRVVQGSVAKPGEYPWQAVLRIRTAQNKTVHWCGAVVIASRWVLTAAHCLEGYLKGAYMVVAGEYNIDENEGTEQQASIEEYYLHENFRKGHKMGNDIALILLKGKGFRLNQDIQPICLPDETTDYERELNCTISGYGTVQTGRTAYSRMLRAAWIPIQKMDICKMAHIYGSNIGEGMICAGDLNGGVDACDGDSGGPLACLDNGVFTLFGVTSWGQRCGYANKPGVYVKVSHYKKWIEKIIQLHS